MIFAKHVSDGSFAIEAFEYGVALPFVRTSAASWRPMALSVEMLEENYVDVRSDTEQCKRMIGEAYEASHYILSQLKLAAAEVEQLSLRAIHQRMLGRLGAIDVTAEMIERERPGSIKADFAAIAAAQAKGLMN